MEPPQYSTAFLIRRTGSPSGRRRARVSATSRKQWLRLRTRYRKGLKVCSLLASLTRPARYSVATASSRSRKTLVRICSNECYPPITVRLESCQVDGKPVLAVIVPHSPQRPHFSGHAFRRVGSQNIKSDEAAYSDFITARSSVGAKILENRGKVVTVRTHGKKLGDPKPLAPNVSEHGQFTIEACDPHTVTLQSIASGRRYVEQIENFSVSQEPSGNLLLLVRDTHR